MVSKIKYKGSEIVIKSLLKEKVEYIFGYPGGAIMPIYDSIYKYKNKIHHILFRHEQGAIHAAQGYSRATGKIGVCFATSGPGATNLITGLADALIDNTPLVCITGQVSSNLLGTDAFQETNIIDISMPTTKWNIQVTNINKICEAISKAFYIAKTGRPGPVLIDITKDAQLQKYFFNYKPCCVIENFEPYPTINENNIEKASILINNSQKPFVVIGQGVSLSNAEQEVKNFVEKGDIPFASTLLGLGVVEKNNKLNFGMLGMHGNYAPNILTNKCDLLIAIGMRFDDRVTGNINQYAKQAKIIHIEIDASEINKNIVCHVPLLGDCKKILKILIHKIKKNNHYNWIKLFNKYRLKEDEVVVKKDLYSNNSRITMAEVIVSVNNYKHDDAILVTDVGQHQMIASRYYNFLVNKSQITSGGLGTMGFALPASIGVQFGVGLDRQVICVIGDGGIQMTIQELGTILQNTLPIKIILLNNGFLGMVRQWQELFFNKNYSSTKLVNPDFIKLANAYNINACKISNKKILSKSIKNALNHHGPFLLEIQVEKEYNVFPMIPSGSSVDEILLK